VAHLMGVVRDTLRLWRIARTLARHDALVPREYLDAMPPSAKFARFVLGVGPTKDKGLPPGQRLSRALESLGPAHIKLGQVLATRPDLVGDDIARALENLQDRLPPFPMAQAKAVIESEFGKSIDVLFSEFGEPI